MKEVLTFILNHCLGLIEQHGFRFVDSFYSASFGGSAYVTLESPNLRLRFTLDRGQLLLEFASSKKRKSSWYSIDLLSQLITGNVETSAVLNEHYARFLTAHITRIDVLFSGANIDNTVQALKKLARERAARLFG